PALLDISASVYVTFVGLDGLDDVIEPFTGQRGCGQYTRLPCAVGHWKDAESVHELPARFLRGGFAVAVRLRDHDDISHLHGSPLDALKLVAGARQRQEQEAVDHRMDGRLRLAGADGLYDDEVESRCLAQEDGLAGSMRDRTESPRAGGWP